MAKLKLIKASQIFQLTALATALALAGCGGGTDIIPVASDGSSVSNDGSGQPINIDKANIYLETSKPNLNTGSDTMELSARVTDENGGVLSSVPVTFAIVDPAKYGLSFDQPASMLTDENGLAKIGLVQTSTGLDSQINHEAEVVISIAKGNITSKQKIEVTGTRTTSTTVLFSNGGNGNLIDLSGTLLDGKDQPLKFANVELINASNSLSSTTTNAEGDFLFESIDPDQLTAENGQYSFDLAVTGDNTSQAIEDIASVSASSNTIGIEANDIVVDTDGTIVVKAPTHEGKTVTLSTSKGKLSSGGSVETQTISGGQATFVINSSVPGGASLKAQIGDDQNSISINFLSVTPTKLATQVKRSEIAINSTTEVTAKVLDVNDAPVKNAKVQFSIVKDASGGRLSDGLVLTDEFGSARVTYTSGENPTANNGVVVRTTVIGVELPDGSEKPYYIGPVDTGLTVQTTSSSIAFGFSDKLQSGPRDVYYYRNASVFVTNNAGQPARNQEVSIALRPKEYAKGEWFVVQGFDSAGNPVGEAAWSIRYSTPSQVVDGRGPWECKSEDVNFNSFLDIGEDYNNSGKLESGYDATILVDGEEVASVNGVYNLVTDENGKTDFQIRYLKEYAEWLTMDLEATTRVDGTESVQKRPVYFPVLIDDVDISNNIRPNDISPFGRAGSCKNPN